MENGKPGTLSESEPNANTTHTFLVDHSLYFYAPNKAAPVFFAVAYAVSGLVHLWQCL